MKKQVSLIIVLLLLSNFNWSQNQLKKSLFYETKQDQLGIDRLSILDVLIDSIRENNKITKVMIEGFCDDIGKADSNLTLSLNRAQNIGKYFHDNIQEISSEITVSGLGEIQLDLNLKTSKTDQRKNNRRVDITIHCEEKTPLKTEDIESELTTQDIPIEIPPEEIITESNKIGDKIVLDNILFEGGLSELLIESYPAVRNLADLLIEKEQYHIQIQGHIFDPNNLMVDNTLSEERAKVIYDFLIKKGVSADRLSYRGFGGEFPLGKDPKFDRRVEIEIIDIQ